MMSDRVFMHMSRFLIVAAAVGSTTIGARGQDLHTSSDIVDGYPVHIYASPDQPADPKDRGVLILGTFSDANKSIADAQRLINPSTGRPYDVIIGVGAAGMPSRLSIRNEWERTLIELSRVPIGHVRAEENGAAVRKAIEQRFGGPLEAGYVDMHSNGTPVGLTCIEQGGFTGLRQLHMMGPDVGFAGQYVAEKRLNALTESGVEEIHLHRIKGDYIHSLGWFTAAAQHARIFDATLATRMRDSILELMGLPASSIVNYHEYEQANVSGVLDTHYATRYIAMRARASQDPVLIKDTRQAMGAKEFDHATKKVTSFAEMAETVGGVRIEFDERILASVLMQSSDEQFTRLVEGFGRRIARASSADDQASTLAAFEAELATVAKQAHPTKRVDHLAIVSMKSLVSRAEQFAAAWHELPETLRHPGRLTRIHGFVSTADDIVIVGQAEPGAEPVDIDDLVVGMRAAWESGSTPLASLDPDPAHIRGDPRVRVQGVPADSSFAEVMIAADYAMKRILFGVQPVDVPGMSTLKKLAQEVNEPFFARLWLTPVQPGIGAIQMSHDGGVALFSAGIQVLSEDMKLLHDGVVGSGRTLGPPAEAARSFTAHYEEIARQEASFARLRGLFDIVLLGRVLARSQPESALLNRLCSLPYVPVALPRTMPAIQVELNDGLLFGGVDSRMSVGSRNWLPLEDDDLRSLHKTAVQFASRGDLAAALPGVHLTVISQESGEGRAVLALRRAASALVTGEPDEALRELNELLQSDPFNSEAFLLRANVHLRLAAYRRARRDAQRALNLNAESPIVAGAATEIIMQCQLIEGDSTGTFGHLDGADSESRSVHAQVARGDALLMLGRRTEARATYKRAVEADPASATAYARLAVLELIEGKLLAAKPLIEIAQVIDPEAPDVLLARAVWEQATIRPDRAAELAGQVWANRAINPNMRIQALTVLVAVAASREQWSRVDEYIVMMQELGARRPDVLLQAAEIAFTWGERERASQYVDRAAELSPGHPRVVEWRRRLADD